MKQSSFILSVLAAFSMTGASTAQTTFNEDVSINGNGSEDQLCVGDNCDNDETYESNKVKIRIKDENTALEFFDVDGQNWMIEANQGTPSLKIGRDTAGPRPFIIDSTAPENALFIGGSGFGRPEIGIGTTLPRTALHINQGSSPTIRLENPTNSWDIRSNASFIWFQNDPSGNFPFVVSSRAPNDTIRINGAGNIGLGTSSPEAPLELSSDDAFNFFRITATAATNPSVDITFTGGPLGTGQLRYNIVDGDNQEMSLDADGNVVIDGTLTTSGPTCSGGCDRVFEADYPLPSIPQHARQMYAAGHLPSIGATEPHAPVNLSERQGKIINSLEHAHIYINQLHSTVEAERAHVGLLEDKVAALTLRLDALEAE